VHEVLGGGGGATLRPGPARAAARRPRNAPGAPRARGPRRTRPPLSGAALRGRAAPGRPRPSLQPPAEDPACRRADRQPRRRHPHELPRWLPPPLSGHWMTAAPSAVEARVRSATIPVLRLTMRL
jgi:hypothetical protein